MAPDDKEQNWNGWKKAISRSLNWVEASEDDETVEFFDAEEGHHNKAGDGPSGVSLMLVAAICGAAGFFLGRQKR